jgi:hypothetical protein
MRAPCLMNATGSICDEPSQAPNIEQCPFANLPPNRSGYWGEGVTAKEMPDY